jgi:hypothetical protein
MTQARTQILGHHQITTRSLNVPRGHAERAARLREFPVQVVDFSLLWCARHASPYSASRSLFRRENTAGGERSALALQRRDG